MFGFWTLTAAVLKIQVLWDVAPCRLDISRRFERSQFLHKDHIVREV